MKPNLNWLLNFFVIFLLVTTSVVAAGGIDHGNATLKDKTTVPREFSDIIIDQPAGDRAEDELLKAYLETTRKLTDLAARDELARIQLQRDIFGEYSHRWWEDYREKMKDIHRDEKRADYDLAIKKYWDNYYAGLDKGQELLREGIGPNRCEILVASINDPVYLGGTAKPKGKDAEGLPNVDPFLSEAFHRGLVAAAPQCLLKDLQKGKAVLTKIYEDLSKLQKDLYEYQKRVALNHPDEIAVEKLYEDLTADLLKAAKDEISKTLPLLQKSAKIDSKLYAKFKESADWIADFIDCSNLTHEKGHKVNCDVSIIAAPNEMTLEDAYRILLRGDPVGPFLEDIRTDGIVDAVAVYKQFHPEDHPALKEQVDKMIKLATQIEDKTKVRFDNLKARFATQMSDALIKFRDDHLDTWRNHFAMIQSEQLINYFFRIQQQIKSFEDLSLGTQDEASLLSKVKDLYASNLTTAASIELNYTLPQRQIVVDLEDDEFTELPLHVDIPPIPAGLLLGQNHQDVDAWLTHLSLK